MDALLLSRGAVHPRACGEHWGFHVAITVTIRFIPAPAGNTKRNSGSNTNMAVHPRACGEHPIVNQRR